MTQRQRRRLRGWFIDPTPWDDSEFTTPGVTLSAAYDQTVTMSYATVNGTATTGNGDYIAKTGTLTFNPGQTTKTIAGDATRSDGDAAEEASLAVDESAESKAQVLPAAL